MSAGLGVKHALPPLGTSTGTTDVTLPFILPLAQIDMLLATEQRHKIVMMIMTVVMLFYEAYV